MEPQIFNIPACNLGILEKKMARLNKKAVRAGTTPITLTKVSETVEKNKDGSVDVFYQIVVEGETPKIAGWDFLATLDHNCDPTGESNLVYVMPGQTCPDDYRQSPADCDHCGYRRSRRKTYVLQHEDTGELKQVGHTCVKDFIGLDPAKVAAQAERIVKVMKAANEAEESGVLGVPYDRRHIDLERFLAYTAMVVRMTGWTSGKEAYESQGARHSSANNALGDMFPVGGIVTGVHDEPEAVDEQKARDALTYALTLDRAKNDYNHNVVTMATTGYIDWKATGIAGSIIRIYDLHIERETERAAAPDLSGSEHMGNLKDRITGEVTVIGKKHGEGHYGPWTMIRMITNQGNVLVTFATGSNFNPDVGDKIKIKGTVKKHDEFNGVKQTMLNRVAFA